MIVIITFTFCCDNLWKSKFVALEKPGKLREFFSPTLWPPCHIRNFFSFVYSVYVIDIVYWQYIKLSANFTC